MEGYCSTTLLGRFFSFLDRWFTGNHLCWPRTTKRPFSCLIMYMFQFHNETNFDKISFCNTTVAGSMIGVNCGAALWNMKLFRISRTQLFSSVKNAHGGDLSSMQWIVPGTYTGTPSLFSWQAIIFRKTSLLVQCGASGILGSNSSGGPSTWRVPKSLGAKLGCSKNGGLVTILAGKSYRRVCRRRM